MFKALYKVFQFVWLTSIVGFFLFFVLLSQNKPDSPEYSQNAAIWAISIGLGVISYILYLVFRTLSTKDKRTIPSEAIRYGFIATAICVFGWGALAFSMNNLGYTYEKKHPTATASVLGTENQSTSKPMAKVEVDGTSTQKANSTEPKIDCTGPDGKIFKTTQKDCDNFRAAWGKGTNPTPPPVNQPVIYVQTAPTSSLNFYCYDNTYKYSYYTSSGEQCNTNNLKSISYKACSDLAKMNVWEPCANSCKTTSNNDTQICLAAYYSGSNSLIKDDFNLYQECSNEVNSNFSKCLDVCGPSYQDALTKCNK